MKGESPFIFSKIFKIIVDNKGSIYINIGRQENGKKTLFKMV